MELVCFCCIFFFFKQKTAYEMRISDWSSDVCSSDLFTYVTYGVLPWAPTLMTRKFALEPAQAGLMIGVVTLAGGIVGALAGGAMSDRWISHGTPGGRMRAMFPCSIGTAIAVPCFAVARSEEHTSEIPSLIRISIACFCLNKKQK